MYREMVLVLDALYFCQHEDEHCTVDTQFLPYICTLNNRLIYHFILVVHARKSLQVSGEVQHVHIHMYCAWTKRIIDHVAYYIVKGTQKMSQRPPLPPFICCFETRGTVDVGARVVGYKHTHTQKEPVNYTRTEETNRKKNEIPVP
jgi:hypothetical protein